MGTESIMYVLVGTCWIAGTVYLFLDPGEDSLGIRPLGHIRSEDFFPFSMLCIGTQKRMKGEGRGQKLKNERQQEADITHSPFSVGSISGNSRKMVL